MQVYYEALSDVTKYIENHRDITFEQKERQYENYLRAIRRYVPINSQTEILEIGTGNGWFPILCKLRGLPCKGIEISPQLVEIAMETGRERGIVPDIELGNLEDYPLPENHYDVVMASSVFEHVENWRTGMRNVYRTLKPGGVLFFESTNKLSFTSGEYTGVPLYGWLPNACRYALRKRVHGEDIMKLGIDFHQFTHGGLRREFKRVGFSQILDRIDIADEQHVSSNFRRRTVRTAKSVGIAKTLALTFAETTRFICIK
jgi:2-polyprenyl-3-methyl-5-hydroxy-6-metoxy-1,4-benzoquinol methylase